MRIAVWHNLLNGGANRLLYNQVVSLVKRGHYIEMWTTDESDIDFMAFKKLIKVNVVKLDKVDKFRYWNRFFKPLNQYLNRRCEMLKNSKKCVEEIESRQFDLIFVHSCNRFYMSFIGLFSSLPTIMQLGEPYRYLYEAFPNNPWALPSFQRKSIVKTFVFFIHDLVKNYVNRLQVKHEIEAAESYSEIITYSMYSKESILRAYGIESIVVYPGIDLENHLDSISEKENIILGVGYIYALKGIDRAIESIAMLPNEKRPKLIWVGNGADDAYLKKMVDHARQLAVDLEFKINISDNELKMLFNKSEIMIYMPRLEPFGLAPLEANLHGVFVIGIAEGGVRETIIHGVNGFLAKNKSIEEVAYWIDLYSKIEDKSTYIVKARSHVKDNYDINKSILGLEKIFQTVISESNLKE